MSEGMAQMHDEAPTFEEALAGVKEALAATRRAAAAYMMATYPNRDFLNETASNVRRQLHAASVEVNTIYNDKQIRVGGAPASPAEAPEMSTDNSLCVITVGVNHALAVNDIAHDPVVAGHDIARQGQWSSWASVPVYVDGCAAGTICALETTKARNWTQEDQEILEASAAELGARIERWGQV